MLVTSFVWKLIFFFITYFKLIGTYSLGVCTKEKSNIQDQYLTGFWLKTTRGILCLPGHNEKGAHRTMKVKRPLGEQRKMFVARIKIMWEE